MTRESLGLRLLVTNTGETPVRIDAIQSDDPDVGIDAPVGIELGRNGAMEVQVRFESSEPRTVDANLTVESDAPRLQVPIAGTVVARPSCVPDFGNPSTVGLTQDPSSYEESPVLATDGAGTWLAVFSSDDTLGDTIGGEFDLFFSRSTDGGVVWSPAVPLLPELAASDGERVDQRPRIVYAAGTWMVTWQSSLASDGSAAIYMSRSQDGRTFAPQVLLAMEHDDAKPAIATDGARWLIGWHAHDLLSGTVGQDGDIAFVRSDNAGETWSGVDVINQHAASDDTWDGDVALTAEGPDRFVAVWSSTYWTPSFGPDPDILFAQSDDGGATWSEAQAVSRTAADDAITDFEPAIASGDAGDTVVAWASADGSVTAVASSDGGATWLDPAAIGSFGTPDPRVSVATDGAGTFAIAWHAYVDVSGTGTEGDILGVFSTDGGQSWSAAGPLSPLAMTDADDDFAPSITTDGSVWMVAYQSANRLLGLRDVCP